MARIKDVPGVLKSVGKLDFAKRVWRQVDEDAVFTWGAALAYSWMFAIFPFLVFLLSLVPLVPQSMKLNVSDQVRTFANETLPEDAGSLLVKQVDAVLQKPSAGGFLSFGLILTIWAASGGMQMTMQALDKAYDIEKPRPYIKQRTIAVLLTMAVATLIILLFILLPVGTGVITWLSKQGTLFGWLKIFINVARYALSLLLMITVLALIYYFGPSFKQKFQAITPGAVFCIVVWILLGAAFKLYLTKFGGAASYNKTYGAVAGAAILLLFFYIDALVLLIGAEINSEIDFAVLGLSAGSQATGAPAAPLPSANEPEQQALAKELVARGSSGQKNAPPELKQASMEKTSIHSNGHSSMLMTVMMTITGISLLMAMRQRRSSAAKLVEDSHARAERMRQMYPMTHALINKTDGDGNLH